MTSTARLWVCRWTLTSPTWLGSTLHARWLYWRSISEHFGCLGPSSLWNQCDWVKVPWIIWQWQDLWLSSLIFQSCSLRCSLPVAASIYLDCCWCKDLLFPQAGGLGHIHIPLLSDLNKQISRDYGVLLEAPGIALRWGHALFKVGNHIEPYCLCVNFFSWNSSLFHFSSSIQVW